MKYTKLLLILPLMIAGKAMAQEAVVKPIFSKALVNFPGKEALMIALEYPPGWTDPAGDAHLGSMRLADWLSVPANVNPPQKGDAKSGVASSAR